MRTVDRADLIADPLHVARVAIDRLIQELDTAAVEEKSDLSFAMARAECAYEFIKRALEMLREWEKELESSP